MKKRIIVWVICLLLAFGYIAFNEHQKSLPVEKTTSKHILKMYNDVGNQKTIEKAFNSTTLGLKNELKFGSKSSKAELLFTKHLSLLSDDDSDKGMLTSFTPLVIGMKNSSNLEKYESKKLLTSTKRISNSIEDEITIDFKKVIDAVIKGDTWSKFGGQDKAIKVIVPEDDSIEGKLFYNFLLITINNGSYPPNDETLEKAKEEANNFLRLCEKKESTINELKKLNSVNTMDLYILFEADFINSSIWSQKKLDISIAYPSTTVVKHIYMESSQKQQDQFIKFFDLASTQLNYRTSNTHSFTIDKNYNIKDDITFIEAPIEDYYDDDDFAEHILIMLLIVACAAFIIIFAFVIADNILSD